MSEDCVRSITFVIPGKNGEDAIQVYAEEVNGTLAFTVTALNGADMRGLFFHVADESLIDGLSVVSTDPLLTESQVGTNSVIDLGQGNNMHGAVHEGFDVGLEFGTPGSGHDVVGGIEFTLIHETEALTLDDIANVLFGARTIGGKLLFEAPAAPDAIDDQFDIFEDGASGLDDPSTDPEGVTLDVLANDTDADGDVLQITDVSGAEHGTVAIVEGPGGDFVLYTPDEDFSGTDTFEYCVDDGNGGTDFAYGTIDIEAVADIPDLSWVIAAGDAVNEIRLTVTATQTDADSSEFIDRIFLTGLPIGVTATDGGIHDPLTEPDTLTHEFILTLPLGEDTSFLLGINVVAEETSNGDEQLTTETQLIEFEHNLNQFDQTFVATDQSIWDTGDEFTFTDDTFIGIDESFSAGFSAFVFANVSASVTAGFHSVLNFEGGEIDANVDYDLTVETNYNVTTDSLLISSAANVTGGDFHTTGPEGSYDLDFIFNYSISANAGLDFLVDDVTLFDFTIADDNTIDILSINSDDAELEVPLPFGITGTFQWPNISTDASPGPGADQFSSNGASNNFFELGVDVDQLLADIFLGGVNPFDIDFDIGVAEGTIEVLDFDVNGGMNFLQSFLMDVQGLPGTLLFENGDSLPFVFGSDILLQNASAIDQGGNQDGNIDFVLSLDPDVQLTNDTDLGFNVGYDFELLQASGTYDIGVDSGSWSVGPLVDESGTLPIADVDVFDSTFALDFGAENVAFFA